MRFSVCFVLLYRSFHLPFSALRVLFGARRKGFAVSGRLMGGGLGMNCATGRERTDVFMVSWRRQVCSGETGSYLVTKTTFHKKYGER